MESHQKKLIECAEKLGLQVELLQDSWQLDAVRYSNHEKSMLVLFGRVFEHLNSVADGIAENKVAGKALMAELGIPVPASYYFTNSSFDFLKANTFLKQHSTCVIKPLNGTDGQGILMHVKDASVIEAHIQKNIGDYQEWLLEEQVDGGDLRIQCFNGELLAACVRKPCTLVGNGKLSISDLITQRNALIRQQNPENHIDIDAQVERRLLKAGLDLSSVLDIGQSLQIKDVANMAQGAHAVDVTDQVHPTYKKYLAQLATALNIKFFALDVMTTDLGADPTQHAKVLEFNAQPAWMHHTFSEVKQHDIPRLLLEDYFGDYNVGR